MGFLNSLKKRLADEEAQKIKSDPEYSFFRKHSPVGSRMGVLGILCGLGSMLFFMYYSCHYYLSSIFFISISVIVMGKILRFVFFKFFVRDDYSGFSELKFSRSFFMFNLYFIGLVFGLGISFVFFIFWKSIVTGEQFVSLNCNF